MYNLYDSLRIRESLRRKFTELEEREQALIEKEKRLGILMEDICLRNEELYRRSKELDEREKELILRELDLKISENLQKIKGLNDLKYFLDTHSKIKEGV